MSNSESSDDSHEDLHGIHIEPSGECLLSLLDDKNKAIGTLQQQIQNQKLQLAYYLKKELTPPKLEEFSASCLPDATEDSMAINLAINKFYKDGGMKSKTYHLYKRMCFIDEKITSSLNDQEFILRKIVNKLCEFVRLGSGKLDFKRHFPTFITDPYNLELFDKLLIATTSLRKRLNTFRICCNRLMIIEDERNSLVEQVYSMPVDERTNCNYIISLQMEKLQLENEMKVMLKDQVTHKQRIRELNVIEEKLSNMQYQLNYSFTNNKGTSYIDQMLQKVYSEAEILLDLTKEQRKRYEKELLKRQKTPSVERMLLFIRLAMENDSPDKKFLLENNITSTEDLKVFDDVHEEIQKGKDKFSSHVFEEIQINRKECEALTNKLNQASIELEELRRSKEKLQREISEVKLHYSNDMFRLKEERDTYRSQVEDLEAIRQAYAQLVDRQPNTSKMEREFSRQLSEKDKQINALEKLNTKLSIELTETKYAAWKRINNTTLKNSAIKDLQQEIKSKDTKVNRKLGTRIDSKPNQGSSKFPCTSKYNLTSDNDSCDGNVTLTPSELHLQEIFVEEKTINWLEPKEYLQSVKRKKHVKISNDLESKKSGHVLSEISKALDSHNPTHFVTTKAKLKENVSEGSITCFKIYAKKKGQISDVMEAVIKTKDAELEGNIKIKDSRSFCLEINCKTKNTEPSERKVYSDDDEELLKDCSSETLPVYCEPVKSVHNKCPSTNTIQIDNRTDLCNSKKGKQAAGNDDNIMQCFSKKFVFPTKI